MNFHFTKWHGLGNDFIIVNGFTETISDYFSVAKIVCDRHFGIGADGLVLILPSDKADFKMRIFNSDGSEAEMCGNVTRCVARYVYETGLTNKLQLSLETLAGIIKPELILNDMSAIDTIRVDMGEPRLRSSEIPTTGNPEETIIDFNLNLQDKPLSITCVSMGNPHCIIFTDNLEEININTLGSNIETHPMFPHKTNVEFAQVITRQLIRMKVWERGAGITLACGTGACATLVAAVLNNKSDRQAQIQLEGGTLLVEWQESNNHVYMSGPAVEVFRGHYCG